MNLWWSEHCLLDQSNIQHERWTCKSPDLWECFHTDHFWKFNLFGNQGPSCFHKLLLDHKKNGCCYHTLHNLGAHALVKACQTLETYHLDDCIQCTWRETNIASKQASPENKSNEVACLSYAFLPCSQSIFLWDSKLWVRCMLFGVMF